MVDLDVLAKRLTEAQRAFVMSLPNHDQQPKFWLHGMSERERAGLRGFGKSGLIESRYEKAGVSHRLSSLGTALRAHLKDIQDANARS